MSIRFVLFSSLAIGKSSASNLLMSDDVINTIECIKNLGIKVKQKKIKFQFMEMVFLDLITKE